jgi:hypothetical protein
MWSASLALAVTFVIGSLLLADIEVETLSAEHPLITTLSPSSASPTMTKDNRVLLSPLSPGV